MSRGFSRVRRALLAAAILIIGMACTTGAVRAQQLEQTLERVARGLERGDADAISRLGARAGISLDIDGNSVGPLGPRQASAVLRRLFGARETIAVRTTLVRRVGGEPQRAFAEITWNARARGTTVPEQAKFFVAFVEEDARWQVTEIRLLR
ncbi:MAG: hypothetical protein WD054_01540 [Gemmatimonadota bacterium]